MPDGFQWRKTVRAVDPDDYPIGLRVDLIPDPGREVP